MSNTLFNYFKKANPSPATPGSPAPTGLKNTNASDTPKQATPLAKATAKQEVLSSKKDTSKKLKMADKENVKVEVTKMEVESDDEIVRPVMKKQLTSEAKKRNADNASPKSTKRRRLMVMSDSEDEEDVKKETSASSGVESCSESEEEKPVTKKKPDALKNKNLSVASKSSPKPTTKKAGAASTSVLSSPSTNKSVASIDSAFDSENSNGPLDIKQYKHFSYSFLDDDKIKDIQGRLKSHPDYDSRTLYVPEDFKKKLTPAVRQWWELKAKNADVILFFKLGKFYELYHMDAVVAVKELGLIFMKGDYAHCGFPEIGYSKYSDSLVSKGYKVARVEQTETPDQMTVRTKGTKDDKTVRREICRITTPGTKTFNMLDSDVANAFSQFLFSIVEKVNVVQDKKVRQFGVCFVDTSVGKIHIGQFTDDRNCSKLRTTLANYPPSHILYDKKSLSKETSQILNMQNGIKDALARDKEMYDAPTVLRILSEADYFKEKDEFAWPESFKQLLSDHDSLGLTAKEEFELAMNAMGGIVWCLKKCLIDTEILTMRNFELYQPVDNLITDEMRNASQVRKALAKQKYMVLDSVSLINLEIFENNFDGTQSGTLFERVDFCMTQFGKRLLKNWLVNPLCDPDAINDRLDAIEDLRELDDQFETVTSALRTLPDLERLVSKVHQLGNVRKDHPDSRAVMFENDVYSKRKVEDFVTILNSFTAVSKMLTGLKENVPKFKSRLLKTILTIIKADETNKKPGFPFLDDLIKQFNASFDAEIAKKTGKIIPELGVNEDYDAAIDEIKSVQKQLDTYLKEQSKKLKCSITYFGTAKNRYQMEIAENYCKNLNDDYELTSSRKGFKRYWTDEIKQMLANMMKAEEEREQALRDTLKFIFKNFDNYYSSWSRAVQCLSILDVLVSFTLYVKNSEHEMCRPQLVVLDETSGPTKPFLDIKNGRHPCLIKTFSGDFIPNDLLIGCEDANNNWQKNPLMLVTGPNMGGKSTLMRQAGLTVILAQIGCFVPAESCRLSPVDRIFTRIGATDKILAGESTFFLELSETASILHHATKHSLVLMDELGRGTATFDGTSIAYSVVKELATKINCRTLFSTHYHHLVEEFSHADNVSMGHMQCMVSDDEQTITFLYKFGEGACPKSHGFNAARLADIPEEIIKLGSAKSVEFENFTKRIQFLKKMMHAKGRDEIDDLASKFKTLKS